MQISLPVLAAIIFVILKLTHVIAWSWWWVTAPLWVSAAFGALVVATLLASAVAITRASRRR